MAEKNPPCFLLSIKFWAIVLFVFVTAGITALVISWEESNEKRRLAIIEKSIMECPEIALSGGDILIDPLDGKSVEVLSWGPRQAFITVSGAELNRCNRVARIRYEGGFEAELDYQTTSRWIASAKEPS